MAFLLGADRSRFGKMIEDMENDFLQGRNNYPLTMSAAYNLLTNWKQDSRYNAWRPQNADGIMFVNVEKKPGRKAHITCFKCGEKGHYTTECNGEKTTETKTGVAMLNAGVAHEAFDGPLHFQFLQNCNLGVECHIGNNGRLPVSWILLDNQSTVDVFCNHDLLIDIRSGEESMTIHCNAGVATTNMTGNLQGYGRVWHHPDSIANILSLSRVKEHGYRVTYDSHDGNKFVIHKKDGTVRTFLESKCGLFYLDTNDKKRNNKNVSTNGEAIFVNTVADNRSKYTNRAYLQAALARKIQKNNWKAQSSSVHKNCVKQSFAQLPHNKGRHFSSGRHFRTRCRIAEDSAAKWNPPASLMSQYRNVTLPADIMYVNKLPFFVTLSRNIKFCTAQLLTDQKQATLVKAVKHVRATYGKRGFVIETMLMDGQFEVLMADLAEMGLTLNTVARGDHVPEIEQMIRTIKERARCVYSTLPFEQIPERMLAELIY